MNKIFKFMLTFLLVFSFTLFKADAEENDSILKTEYIDNVYAYHYKNGVLMSYGKLPYRYQNGRLSYCIEPWKIISTNNYSSNTDWSISGYSENDKIQMELIAHYGYGYEGHNTKEYYMATQELIWLFKDDYVKWTDSLDSGAKELNVEKEKSEILNLVSKHNIVPSFSGRCYIQYFNDKLTINDDNNVLSNYNVNTDLEYSINGNLITFNLDKFGTHKVVFNQKNSSNNQTIIYKSSGIESQTMVSFGFDNLKSSEFTISSNKVHVRINKRDYETRDLIKNEEAIFKIKNMDTSTYIIEDLKIDKNGYAVVRLPKGKYEIEELKAPNGYVVNEENRIIDINDNISMNGSFYDVDIFNSIPKGEIKILKVGEDNETIEGVKIGLYDENHELIEDVVTDENGIAEINNLNLGTYYIKEISTIEGYILDSKYHEIILEYKDDKTYVVEKEIKLVNKKVKCDVVYISEDTDKNRIKNIEINVYNETGNIVYNGTTNSEGKIIIKDLPYGKYYITQVKVPSGYILNEEEMSFSVNDLSCVSDIVVINKKTEMPITTSSNLFIKNIIPLLLIGIIIVFRKLI